MDGLFSDEELFLTQNSFSEERVEDNFSIDSILYGLVACDEPVSQNSCGEELKQVVTEKSIKDGRTDPSNYPEAVRKIVIVDDEELEKRKMLWHRDVRSLQKYQRPEISTKIEFSKAFDTSNEAVSLSGSIGSQKAPLKREVELEEESTRKFSKSCDEARIPETKAMTFNQCTFIISKD